MVRALAFFAAAALFAAQEAPRRISLDIKDASLQNVLRLIADVGHINLVVPDDVQGRVTLRLRNVPWTEVLEVVLRSKGLGKEVIGGVYQIDTLERLLARQRTKAEIVTLHERSGALVTVMIPLSHARAAEVAPLVRGMLSDRGRVEIDARTNTLIVTDVSERTDAVRSAL